MNHVTEALLDIYKVSVLNGKQIVSVVCLRLGGNAGNKSDMCMQSGGLLYPRCCKLRITRGTMWALH